MKRLPVALLRSDEQNTEMEGDVTGDPVPGAMQRSSRCFAEPDRPKRGVCDGPGSAVHHAHSASKTRVNALMDRRAAPRPGHERSHPLRHFLLLAGKIFSRHRALVSITRPQALPVGRDVRAEI